MRELGAPFLLHLWFWNGKLVKRADFLFVIGYNGEVAVVDGQQRRRYGKLSTRQLLNKGQYRAAFCSADYKKQVGEAGADEELELVRSVMEDIASRSQTIEDIRKLFGVFGIPPGIKRVVVA